MRRHFVHLARGDIKLHKTQQTKSRKSDLTYRHWMLPKAQHKYTSCVSTSISKQNKEILQIQIPHGSCKVTYYYYCWCVSWHRSRENKRTLRRFKFIQNNTADTNFCTGGRRSVLKQTHLGVGVFPLTLLVLKWSLARSRSPCFLALRAAILYSFCLSKSIVLVNAFAVDTRGRKAGQLPQWKATFITDWC